MAYPDGLIGKFFDSPIANPALAGRLLPNHQNGPTLAFVETQTRQVFRAGGTPLVQAVGGAGAGQDIQAPSKRPVLSRTPAFEGVPWTYQLLQYIPGLVTASPMAAEGILTGWMSGCYLFRYLYRGARYAAHVGTDVDSPDNTRLAKQIWRAFAEQSGATEIVGCNVAREVSDEAIGACHTAQLKPHIAGYFAANGSARILTFGTHQRGTEGPGVYHKLVAIDMMPMTPWAALRQLPAFT